MLWTFSAEMTCSVHRWPSQYRPKCRADGSFFQPAGRCWLDPWSATLRPPLSVADLSSLGGLPSQRVGDPRSGSS